MEFPDDFDPGPEYFALVERIRAEPAADLHRLVLADWLDEHGYQPLAIIVRLQTEQQRLKRELEQNEATWRAAGLKWDAGFNDCIEFRPHDLLRFRTRYRREPCRYRVRAEPKRMNGERCWVQSDSYIGNGSIPTELFSRLPSGRRTATRELQTSRYQSNSEADRDLLAAVAAWIADDMP
jgi:uncharacterized protein (TIGR02996 family)